MPKPQKSYSYEIKDYNIDIPKFIGSKDWSITHGSTLKYVEVYQKQGKAYVYFSFTESAKGMDKTEEEQLGVIRKVNYQFIKLIREGTIIYIKDADQVVPEVKFRKYHWKNRLIMDGKTAYQGWIEIKKEVMDKEKVRLVEL